MRLVESRKLALNDCASPAPVHDSVALDPPPRHSSACTLAGMRTSASPSYFSGFVLVLIMPICFLGFLLIVASVAQEAAYSPDFFVVSVTKSGVDPCSSSVSSFAPTSSAIQGAHESTNAPKSLANVVQPQRNLILGVATNLDLPWAMRYIGSIRRFMKPNEVDIVLFTDAKVMASEDLNKTLTLLYAKFYLFDEEDFSPQVRKHNSGVARLRFYALKGWLDAIPNGTYQDVFICDNRDLVFQANVFGAIRAQSPLADLVVFYEASWQTIGNCRFNKGWVDSCGGVAELLYNRSISCSGTTFGSFEGIKVYLDEMTKRMSITPLRCTDGGTDQGIHNILVHEGVLAKRLTVDVFANELGAVCTLGYAKEVRMDAIGNLVNERGQIYAVLHQFDRWRRISDFISMRYALPLKEGILHNE
jgi:hypothetical protein